MSDEDLNPTRRPDRQKKSGASQSGVLYTQTKGQRSQAHMQVDFERTFGFAGMFTLQFYVDPPKDPINPAYNGFYQAFAEITWSVEGNFVKRLVSIGDGVSISGCGQAVDVQVFDVTIPLGTIPPNVSTPGLQYRIGMQVTRGTRPSQNQPPTFVNTLPQTILAGGNFAFQVPQGAGIISVKTSVYDITTPAAAKGVSLVAISSAGVNPNPQTTLIQFDPMSDTDFVPLPPGATQVIVHASSTDSILANVTWGVDG
jgi:hypothetical protein